MEPATSAALRRRLAPSRRRSMMGRRRGRRGPLHPHRYGGTPRPGRTIVVGAGAAGLAAARALRAMGRDVVLVEARDRVGGRVWTSTAWAGVPIDMGASWIHGCRGNPVSDLRDEYGIASVETDLDSMLLYAPDGSPLSPHERERVEECVDQVFADVDRELPDAGHDDSPAAALDRAVARTACSADDTLLRGVRFRLWQSFQNEYGEAPENVSYRWYSDAVYLGLQEVFPDGFGAVFQAMAADLEPRLGHVVEEIEYGRGDGVTVHTSRGSIEGDDVIVTLPLGVLKRGGVLFTPRLPREKLDAIERLEMGTLSKTWLRFPRAFWDEGVLNHGYLGTADHVWSDWYSFSSVLGEPVLLGLNGGMAGREIERHTDREIAAAATAVLRKCFGPRVPEPIGIQNSRWETDPYAFGSYSYTPAGAGPADREALARPVGGRLFFAGEATHTTCHQTVHGAVLSGRRAAEQAVAAVRR
ncbi:flavin monoamine oxidase family protein [Allostreptomyces psammosilenae]|uniref:Monoamine oxidase n=1 Tax=Allostreptomyces psammosilenae TaxID=1892865 RepID=A0A853A1X8_9ACTN|nr:NAD(P)/FAD-dependent oxidoreductase [Allostreptomyces psammosilenae]NYI08137.1 monoamine oxidase [Allostreptomyces psammosilenae]